MPYNADQPHFYQQYPNQPYTSRQYDGPHYPPVNPSIPYPPLEVAVPQHTNYQYPVNPGYYMNQQTYSQPGHYPQASIQAPYPPAKGHHDPAAAHHQMLAPRQPTIQVEVPSRPVQESTASPVDYQILLLSLAEEYLDAAHGTSMLTALSQGDAQLDDYYKLVSTALGCMETVLKRFRLPPLKEAQLRLRFAQTLYDETENELEAETALSKGIDLCERNKLLDLKYTMQVLMSRVLHRSNAKAATKAIDGIIEDVGAYQHTAWEYAFRFLRASLSLSMPSHQDFVAAIHQLQGIADLAHRKRDQAIFAFAGITEALAHLQSSSPDSGNYAQRALAKARQVQLDQDVSSVPQILVLLQFVDLCCSLRQSNLEQIGQNLATMQQIMDQIVDDVSWLDDGTILLPLTSKSAQCLALNGGGIVQERDSKHVLALAWLPKKDVYTVGYLLSAVATSYKNAQGDHKAEQFIDEGLALVRSNPATSKPPAESLPSSADRANGRKVLECQFLIEKAFLLCARSEWEKARALINELHTFSNALSAPLPPDFSCLIRYLDGAVHQGSGNLTKALTIFQSPDLSLPSNSPKGTPNNIRRDIALLAAMNTILIVRSPNHPTHHLLPSLISRIDPYLSTTLNKHLLSARSLLISNLPTTTHDLLANESLSSTLLIKKHLSTALNIAKTIGNAQITAMTLSVMSAKFFKGVVGDQAEKSARAGQNMAYKSGMKLWMSVSSGMLADTLERQGKKAEAEKVKGQALRLAGMMPRSVQKFEVVGEEAGEHSVVAERRREALEQGDDEERDELA
ncbi:hypothetical protein GJ744_010966 [Endocarpon pusillum]|uniref:Cohesin loading factor n=1 Tax=Endocarpon pusillum TaxID=364733 RepID=A0A8H7ADS3_9EURO|nr:hypothetical protein GJ744_010966 [Endocarpon pusillum]